MCKRTWRRQGLEAIRGEHQELRLACKLWQALNLFRRLKGDADDERSLNEGSLGRRAKEPWYMRRGITPLGRVYWGPMFDVGHNIGHHKAR